MNLSKAQTGITYAYHSRYGVISEAYKVARKLIETTGRHAYVVRVKVKKERVYDVRHQQV